MYIYVDRWNNVFSQICLKGIYNIIYKCKYTVFWEHESFQRFYQLKPPSGATVCTEPSNFKIKSPIPVSPWVRFPWSTKEKPDTL